MINTTTIISIIGWFCCLNIVIESKDDAPNEAANASLFDHLLHPSQQTMQNAVTWANSWVQYIFQFLWQFKRKIEFEFITMFKLQ